MPKLTGFGEALRNTETVMCCDHCVIRDNACGFHVPLPLSSEDEQKFREHLLTEHEIDVEKEEK